MFAAIKKAAPLAALATAAILAGCAVEPAPYYDQAYVYSGPSAVFVDPCCYHYGAYGHYYGPGSHGYGGGFHGGGMHGARG